MASCALAPTLSSSLHSNAVATAKKEVRAGNCEASRWNVNVIGNGNGNGNVSTKRFCGRQEIVSARKEGNPRSVRVQAAAGEEGLKQSEKWGAPVSLGTALLPPDVDIGKLEALLFQWGNSLTANANLPLPTPIKVDKVKGGVRLGYIRVRDGAVEDLVHIDVIVSPATTDAKAYFQASRNGQYKDKVPPGEPLIMQSLLAALQKSIKLARP